MGLIAPLPKMRVIPWPELFARMLARGSQPRPRPLPVLTPLFDDDSGWRRGMPLPREHYAE